MRRPALLLASLLPWLAATVAPAAAASPRILERAGAWQSYFTVNDEHVPICGISQFAGPYGFLIKYFGTSDSASIQLSKATWQVPEGVSIPVALEIDGRPIYSTSFSAVTPTLIDAALPSGDESVELLRLFAAGRTMKIHFLAGNEGNWSAGLTGSRLVADRFIECVGDLYAMEHPAPSQPFDSSSVPAPPPLPARPMPARGTTPPFNL